MGCETVTTSDQPARMFILVQNRNSHTMKDHKMQTYRIQELRLKVISWSLLRLTGAILSQLCAINRFGKVKYKVCLPITNDLPSKFPLIINRDVSSSWVYSVYVVHLGPHPRQFYF